LVLAVQIAALWMTLRASQPIRPVRAVAYLALVAAALATVANLFFHDQIHGAKIVSWVSCLLYLIAPLAILHHLVLRRRVVDGETVLGAIDAYLMVGMFFAFLYLSVGLNQAQPFFGSQGHGTFSQYLFFSFTTVTTTGYGNLVPAANPGQTFACSRC
jgi:Ion channel